MAHPVTLPLLPLQPLMPLLCLQALAHVALHTTLLALLRRPRARRLPLPLPRCGELPLQPLQLLLQLLVAALLLLLVALAPLLQLRQLGTEARDRLLGGPNRRRQVMQLLISFRGVRALGHHLSGGGGESVPHDRRCRMTDAGAGKQSARRI